MTNIELKYPAMLIRENDKNIYGFVKGLGLISKGGHTFYKRKMILIDSKGNQYNLVKASLQGRAKLIDSIKYFQPMFQMELVFEFTKTLELDDLKNMIIEHTNKNSKHWLSLDTKDEIKQSVCQKSTFKEVIKIFI